MELLEYPLINRRNIDRDNTDVTEIGWAEGILSDERPYWLECWAENQTTCMTIFISALGIETWSSDQVMQYLLTEKLYSRTENPFYGSAQTYSYDNDLWWSANIVIGNDDNLYCDSTIPLKSYRSS